MAKFIESLFSATGKKTRAAVFEQVEHKLETFRSLIVGVGNMVVAHSHIHKRGHRHNLILSLGSGCHPAEVAHIVGVHTYDYIEIVEILLAYLPATMRQLKTTATGMHPHSVVGELPYMVTSSAGRINHPAGTFTALFDYPAHNALGSRRAAYITQTYK